MKKLLLPLALALPLTVFAGEGHEGHHKGERQFESMMERLDLSEAQKGQMKEIFTDHREQMRTLREKTEARVDAILTPEQRKTMQAMREEREEKWRDRMQDRREERREERKEKREERQGKKGD